MSSAQTPPLATIAVVVRELERAAVQPPIERKLAILKDQIRRCKSALSTLSASAEEARAEGGGPVSVASFVNSLVQRWQSQREDNIIRVDIVPGPETARIIAEQTLTQALINVLNNAADASDETIGCHVKWDMKHLDIDIFDRGPGLPQHTADRMDQPKDSQKEFGMGLGLFLSHATIQRLDGTIELSDRPGGGTHTHIRIPLSDRL